MVFPLLSLHLRKVFFNDDADDARNLSLQILRLHLNFVETGRARLAEVTGRVYLPVPAVHLIGVPRQLT